MKGKSSVAIKKIIGPIFLCLLAILVAAFNFFLIQGWFFGDGPANLGSIEVSYVSMAKFLVTNRPHLSWAPFWYFGFPFHLFYTPLLPVLVAVLKNIFGVSFWQAYRIISGLGFVLGPVSLFFLVWYLSKNKIAALASGFFYSVIPNIFNFILPSGEVRADSFSDQFVDPRRLVNLARWGEGPHTLSLVFLSLAGLFFFKTLKDRRTSSIFLAAFFTGLTALTNAVGFYALVLLLVSFFLIEIFFHPKRRVKSLVATILAALLTFGLIAFWYNLSFIGTFFGESGGALKNWLNMFPWGWFFLAGSLFLIILILKLFVKAEVVSAVFLWTLALFSIVAIYYFSAPPEFWPERIELVPQALRLMTELDMGMAVLVGLIIGLVTNKLSQKNKALGNGLSLLLGGTIVAGCLFYGLAYAPVIQESIEANVDLEETYEKRIADWASEHLDSTKGERLFLAGNPAFYLNYFSDVWQLRGGLYQAITHPWPEHIYYQLRMGKDPAISRAWLKIVNVKYAIIDPGSEIEQKDKFKTLPLFTTLARSLVYEVPLTNTSPVKIVNLETMATLLPPKKGDDKKPILAYASWIEERESQGASFKKINNDLYQIKAKVGKREGILVQMTADRGWRVSSVQGKIEIRQDPLGFFVLVPPKEGEYEVTLSHGSTWVLWLGCLITLGTIGGILLIILRRAKILLKI